MTTTAFGRLQTHVEEGKKFHGIENFIGGEFHPPATFKYLDSYNPATGLPWAEIPDSGEKDVDDAVRAAVDAFPSWSSKPQRERSAVLLRIADLVDEHAKELALIESRDQGKPVSLAAAVDIPRCALNFRFFATAALHHTNQSTVQQEPVRAVNYVTREPVGVAGLISPWNLPLYLLSFKLAPALAAGNTVVAKPSEFTSVTAWLLAKIFVEAGLPAGVVNLVFGTGPSAGEPLVRHPSVPLMSFTGSTATGTKIAEISAKYNKKISLEMGGKNPCIVFADADLKKHLSTIVRSSFANQGEICLCSSRIFVQEKIFHSFLESFVKEAEKLVVGPPDSSTTNLGALVSEQHWQKVSSYVEHAKTAGVTIHCGLDPLELPEKNQNGYFIRPTVITGMDDEDKLMQEEIFGPVVCISQFQTEEEVVQRANGVKYGLSASVFSQDVGKVHRVAQGLKTGTVWCNCWLVRELNMPFGGTKASGLGREGAEDSLDFFTEKKNIVIHID